MSFSWGNLFGQRDVRETNANPTTSGTKYASVAGSQFQNVFESEYHARNAHSIQNKTGTARAVYCNIQIPDGATIIAARVSGSDSTNTWKLQRYEFGGAITTIATTTANTEDTSILDGTVDNATYVYVLEITLGDDDSCYGGRVTYTI